MSRFEDLRDAVESADGYASDVQDYINDVINHLYEAMRALDAIEEDEEETEDYETRISDLESMLDESDKENEELRLKVKELEDTLAISEKSYTEAIEERDRLNETIEVYKKQDGMLLESSQALQNELLDEVTHLNEENEKLTVELNKYKDMFKTLKAMFMAD